MAMILLFICHLTVTGPDEVYWQGSLAVRKNMTVILLGRLKIRGTSAKKTKQYQSGKPTNCNAHFHN